MSGGAEVEGAGRVGVWVPRVGGKVVQGGWRVPLSVLVLFSKVNKC